MDKNKNFKNPPPIKKLGQNFLIDNNISKMIVDFSDLKAQDTIIEIGPGRGAITHLLSKKVKKVIAYEIDRKLSENLAKVFDGTNVEIKHQDFLEVDLQDLKQRQLSYEKIIVVANLPYYISSKIIIKILESFIASKLIIMLQKEMAERIMAEPYSKDYNALTVLIKLLTKEIQPLFFVPNTSFFPVPKVESVVVEIVCKNNVSVDTKKFEKFIKQCFMQKRKTILNNLLNYYKKEIILDFLNKASIDPRARPETISVDNYVEIFKMFCAE